MRSWKERRQRRDRHLPLEPPGDEEGYHEEEDHQGFDGAPGDFFSKGRTNGVDTHLIDAGAGHIGHGDDQLVLFGGVEGFGLHEDALTVLTGELNARTPLPHIPQCAADVLDRRLGFVGDHDDRSTGEIDREVERPNDEGDEREHDEDTGDDQGSVGSTDEVEVGVSPVQAGEDAHDATSARSTSSADATTSPPVAARTENQPRSPSGDRTMIPAAGRV